MCLVGLRGITGDLLILEEAAFIPQSLFFEVIAPLLGVEGTAVVAISTPDEDDNNYYSELMEIKNPETPGETLFKTIRIGLACEECIQAGAGATCVHRQQLIPPWKSNRRQKRLRQMTADPHLFMRENMGMITNSTQFMYSAALVNQLRQAPRFRVTRPNDVLYLAIDPSGGGTRSDYAMCSLFVENAHHVIAGLDHSGSANPADVNNMIYTHVMSLRRHPQFAASTFVIIIEANMSWIETHRVAQLCDRPELQPVMIESRDPSGQGRIGVITDEANKVAYVQNLRFLMQDKQLSYNTDLVGTDIDASTHELESQLRQFKRAIKVPTLPEHARYTVNYSGKGHAKKDDLALALMIGCYWSLIIRQSPEFINIAHRQGWQVN